MMFLVSILNLLFLVLLFWNESAAFNLQDGVPIISSNPLRDSYFGYTVVPHLSGNQLQLLVGSPGDNQFSGALYSCNILDYSFNCQKIYPPLNANPTDWQAKRWLGAYVTSLNNSALVCAPREGERVDGECFFSTDTFSSKQPKRIALPDADRNRQWMCQFGFSAVLAKTGRNENTIFIGSPSCFIRTPSIQVHQRSGVEGGIYSTPIISSRPSDIPERQRFMIIGMDNFYASETLATDNKRFLLSSVGFHMNSSFAGKVYWINLQLPREILGSIDGIQPGERFGASLAMADLNNDGLEDMIVGAPHHSTGYNSSELSFEVGAVYIFYQRREEPFFQRGGSDETTLTGQASRGRFGHAIAAHGFDANADGFNDLAIGAPYEDDGDDFPGIGKVYIYYGSRTGLRLRQVISGRSFRATITSSFGFSLAVGDFDSNRYSDVVVGAYKSGAIVYLPARPVVNVSTELSFNPSSIKVGESFCETQAERNLTCGEIQYCSVYSGVGVPSSIDLNITIRLDTGALEPDLQTKRILLISNDDTQASQTRGLKAGVRECWGAKFYVNPNLRRDRFSTTIRAEVTVSLPETSRIFKQLSPILDVESTIIASDNMLTILGVVDVEVERATFASLPWWVYLLCILGALAIMSIVTGILRKLGFFKRKLPPKPDDDQNELTNEPDEAPADLPNEQ